MNSKREHKRKEKVNMKFIPDKEINLLEEDLLGTLPYMETVNNIIENCDTPFTIGLLGGWGSGKSSIVKTLQEKFNNDQDSKIKVFIYDAWKYSKDSFRRTFVLEILKHFSLKFKEKEKMYQTVSQTTEWGFSKILTCKKSTTKHINTLIYPEQFERIFKEIIAKITSLTIKKTEYIKGRKKFHYKKIVIIVDNIDRCHKELATELLLNIKNFLEIENVVFIVPVDEKGLKKYLNLENQDANEFLRKLFNITIKIKKFTGADLFNFCKELNKRYKLNFDDNVLSIISQEFAKNPRRIIQFLNNLQSEKILAKKAEEYKLIEPEGALTNHLQMVAKLLIVREEWPNIYRSISEDIGLLNRINQAFRERQFKFNREENCYKLDSDNINLTTEQYRFFLRTSNISVDQMEPFFVNRDVFRDVPDEINRLVLSQDWETIKEKYIKTGDVSLSRVIEFIAKELDIEVIKRELFQTSGFNLLSLVFKISNDEEYSPEFKGLYNTIAFKRVITVCEMGEIEDLVLVFNAEELVRFSRWLDDKGNEGLTKNIIKAINEILKISEDKKEIKTIKAFIERYNDKPEYLNKIKDKFSKIIIDNPNIIEDLQEILENPISKYLIAEYLIKNFIGSLQANSNQNNTLEKTNTLNALCANEIMSQEMIISYIEKSISFANIGDLNIVNFWLSNLKISFEKVKKDTSGEIAQKIYDLLNNRHQWLYDQYVAGQIQEVSIECYKSFLKLCQLLYLFTDQYSNKIMEWMNSFFWRNERIEVYIYINNLFLEIINTSKNYDWPFSQYIIKRFDSIGWPQKKELTVTLNIMLLKTNNKEGLDQEQISTILTYYLNIARSADEEQSEEAKNWLKIIVKKRCVIERLQTLINSIDNPIDLMSLLDVISEFKNNILLGHVITKIVIQSPCENIENTITDLLKNKKVKIGMIKESIQKKIDQLNIEDDKQHRDCLGKIVKIKGVMNGKLSEKVIDKLRPLLASNDKERQIFSLQCLGYLQEIPDSKRRLLKALMKEIKTDGWQDEENRILSKIKGRVK